MELNFRPANRTLASRARADAWLFGCPTFPKARRSPYHDHPPLRDFGGEGIAGDDSAPNTVPDGGVGKWVYDTFVPHGYALAQASTFGTGQSTHCQDVKGLGEQTGIQAVVDWLGEQEWSNGNVGLMGKSYGHHQLGGRNSPRPPQDHRAHFRLHRRPRNVL